MTKLTWKGEDELHGPDRGGPSYTIWNGIKFAKDKAVDVSDARMIAKARTNKYFTVEGDAPAVKAEEPVNVVPENHQEDRPRRGRPFTKRKVHADEDEE